jgi:hypothetical protein
MADLVHQQHVGRDSENGGPAAINGPVTVGSATAISERLRSA